MKIMSHTLVEAIRWPLASRTCVLVVDFHIRTPICVTKPSDTKYNVASQSTIVVCCRSPSDDVIDKQLCIRGRIPVQSIRTTREAMSAIRLLAMNS
jgi:hypothetical protein